MSRLAEKFYHLKQSNSSAFIPFITAGDGGIEQSLHLMHTLVTSGADIIELGVPFSDPMADGTVIQKANERALSNNISLSDVLTLVAQFRSTDVKTPIVLMGYANPINAYGYQKFANDAKTSGVDGVLVVDLPPEEADSLKKVLRAHLIDLIFLVSPTTSDERLALLAKHLSGFAYFVSLKGVTGAKHIDLAQVEHDLARIRQFINLPIGVGFGIDSPQSARAIAEIAEGVIIGSAIVKIIGQYQTNRSKMLQEVADFCTAIHEGIVSLSIKANELA